MKERDEKDEERDEIVIAIWERFEGLSGKSGVLKKDEVSASVDNV